MPITNSKAFPLQLDRTIVDMFYDNFTAQEPLWKKLMKKTKGPKGADYVRADLAGLGSYLREAAEGEAVEYDVPSEGKKITRTYKKYQLGFQVTEEMLEDELHDKIKSMSSSLGKAAAFTIEARVWALFNSAFGTTVSTAKDGKAIIASNHASIRSGTTTSNVISGDLDTTTLQQAWEYFQNLTGEDDLPIGAVLKMLVVPLAEQWKAAELLKSTGRVFDSGDRAAGLYNKGLVDSGGTKYAPQAGMNMLNPSMNVVSSWDYMPVRYLTDSDMWFAIGDLFDGQVMFKRDVTMQSADDVATGNRLYRCSTRFVPFIDECRGICGSQGA